MIQKKSWKEIRIKLQKDLIHFNIKFAIAYAILLILLAIIWSTKNPLKDVTITTIIFLIPILAIATIPFFSYFQAEEFSYPDLILNLVFLIFSLITIIFFAISLI